MEKLLIEVTVYSKQGNNGPSTALLISEYLEELGFETEIKGDNLRMLSAIRSPVAKNGTLIEKIKKTAKVNILYKQLPRP